MLKKILFTILWLLLTTGSTFAYQELILRNIDGKPVRIIKVVLDGDDYLVTSLAETGGNTLENLTKQVWWITSLNWTFFCPDDYNYCNGKTHSNFERIFLWDGKSYSRYRPDTGIRWIFGLQKDGTPLFVQNNFWYMTGLNFPINRDKINDIFFWLWNFPILLAYGQDVVWASETEIDNKMKSSANKHFICSTKDQSTIYMWAIWWLTIYQLPAYLKKNFDCYFALNLDAWYSSAMVYKWDVIERSPRRRIMDAFVVLNRDQYEQLTNYSPPTKTPFDPGVQYKLTAKDRLYIQRISTICHTFIDKYGENLKRKVISLFRKMLDAPKYQTDKDQAIFHEILVNLYTVDKL